MTERPFRPGLRGRRAHDLGPEREGELAATSRPGTAPGRRLGPPGHLTGERSSECGELGHPMGGPHQPCPKEADLALAPPCGLEPPCPLSPPAERLNQATFPDPVGGLPGILLECMPVTSHRGPDSSPRQEGQESAFLCLGLKCWTGPPQPPSRSDIVRPETALTPSLATAAPSELGRWGARGLRGPSCLGSCPPQEPGKPVLSPTAPTHSERFSKNGDGEGVLS